MDLMRPELVADAGAPPAHGAADGRRTVVSVLSRQGPRSLCTDDVARLRRAADVRFHALDGAPDRTTAAALLRGTGILAATNACLPVLDAVLLDALPALRAVVLYATGYGHIDVDLLAARGIGLSVLPAYATGAVAEHAIAMVLSLATRLHLAHDRSRGLVHDGTSLRGVELAGRTLGVLGVGRIGTRVARLGGALGMRVVGSDTDTVAVVRARAAGIAMADLPALLAASDVLVVCASQAFRAPALLGAAELRRMRPGALLVNVSRAALVDTAAATVAVRAGRLRGYAVDDVVLDPRADGDLLVEGRVLQSGHSAWWRDEVLERGRRMWARNLLAAIAGMPLDPVVWPPRATRGAPHRPDLAAST